MASNICTNENTIEVHSDECMNNEVFQENKMNDPVVGMEFVSIDELSEYYSSYGNSNGFPVKRRSSKKSEDGEIKMVVLACGRSGKAESKTKNSLNLRPTSKTDCKARLRAVLGTDNKWILTSVVLDHNHTLFSPGKSRYYKNNRKISSTAKRRLEINDIAGVRPNKTFNTFLVEAGGHENLSFLEKDCYNDLDKVRKLRLGEGDATAVHNYFVKMQENNINFFYTMDLDEKGTLCNLFRADARSRVAYEEFGDVITFDTTYLTNKYNMPFAPFVGVNHHSHSILLGCGLISNEKADTFTWLFKSWLSCMNGRAPSVIITDQDKAMQIAIQNVFPNSRHIWCLWHIMKKLPEKLGSYADYDSIKASLQNVVYDSVTIEEFEEEWDKFVT